MYKCKTYRGEMRKFLNMQETEKLVEVFLSLCSEEVIRKTIIKELSNPLQFVISDYELDFE